MSLLLNILRKLLVFIFWILSAWVLALIMALVRIGALGFTLLTLKRIFLILGMTSKLVMIRLGLFFKFMPVFLLLSMVGLVDGLIQRDLRRLSGGRESTLIYHQAKGLLRPCLKWSLILYLALPLTVKPETILLPCALFFALSLSVAAQQFKKYL